DGGARWSAPMRRNEPQKPHRSPTRLLLEALHRRGRTKRPTRPRLGDSNGPTDIHQKNVTCVAARGKKKPARKKTPRQNKKKKPKQKQKKKPKKKKKSRETKRRKKSRAPWLGTAERTPHSNPQT